MSLKTYIIFCFFLLNINSYGQIPSTGKIKSDPNFNCLDTTANQWYQTLYGVDDICSSKNKIEIRLYASYSRIEGSTLIIFSFNDGKWDAKKYRYGKGSIGYTVESTIIKHEFNYREVNDHIFNLIFDTLKLNNIFLLPDQKSLKIENIMRHPVHYELTFKVDNSFRSYNFNSPEAYAKEYPDIIELKQYGIIVKYLNSIWD